MIVFTDNVLKVKSYSMNLKKNKTVVFIVFYSVGC